MRLVTFATKDGVQRIGALAQNGVIDLPAAARKMGLSSDLFHSVIPFLEAGQSTFAAAVKLTGDALPGTVLPFSEVRLLPPVPRPGKIIAVGLNYKDHFLESGAKELPKWPMIFAKFPTSISGPSDAIVIPAGDPQVDYEAEMAVVIGRKGKMISATTALEYVAGYMPLNDVSARAWQFADKQWVRGKSCDTFCPIGPHLTTRDEIADPHKLAICARVNGQTLQNSNTGKMIFQIPELIQFISASITLEPGDLIATGTPEGVGAFRKPPIFLKPGDIVEVEIEQLGVLRNPVVAASAELLV